MDAHNDPTRNAGVRIKIHVHVGEDTPVTSEDYRSFATVDIGETTVYLNSERDALRIAHQFQVAAQLLAHVG